MSLFLNACNHISSHSYIILFIYFTSGDEWENLSNTKYSLINKFCVLYLAKYCLTAIKSFITQLIYIYIYSVFINITLKKKFHTLGCEMFYTISTTLLHLMFIFYLWYERLWIPTLLSVKQSKSPYYDYCCYYYFAEKKSSWRGITVQMQAVLPPRVPSRPSPSGNVPPRKEIAPSLQSSPLKRH